MTLTLADIARAIDQGDFDHVPNAEKELRYAFMARQARIAQGRPPVPPKPQTVEEVPALFDRIEEWLEYATTHDLGPEATGKDGIAIHQDLYVAKGLVDHLGDAELRERLHQVARRVLAEVFKVDPDTLEAEG